MSNRENLKKALRNIDSKLNQINPSFLDKIRFVKPSRNIILRLIELLNSPQIDGSLFHTQYQSLVSKLNSLIEKEHLDEDWSIFIRSMNDLEQNVVNSFIKQEEKVLTNGNKKKDMGLEEEIGPEVRKWRVTLDEIIPRINTSGLEYNGERMIYTSQKSYDDETGESASTEYIDGILHYLNDPQVTNFLKPLENTIVLDLGAGDEALGYYLAQECKAKFYIGVDKFTTPLPDKRLERTEDLKERFHGVIGRNHIPHACVEEDMLEFLKRIPSNSVSILTCAVTVGLTMSYARAVEEQISRVLDPDGAYITLFSNFEPKGLFKVKCDVFPNSWGGLWKFTKKRD